MKDTKVKCQSVNARMVSKVPEVVPRFGMLINWNLGTDKKEYPWTLWIFRSHGKL